MAESDKAVSNGKRCLKTKSPYLFLHPGSHAVRTTPKKTWKQKFKDLEEENRSLEEENRSLKEKLKEYENERNRCNKIYQEHEAHLVSSTSCENLQVGNHNNMHVVHNFDADRLEKLLKRYEETEAIMSCRIKEPEKLQQQNETKIEHLKGVDQHFLVQQLTDNEEACPVTSLSNICRETNSIMKTIAPEIARMISLQSSKIDDPKPEFCSAFSASQRFTSTVSLDERNHTADRNKCHRRIHSELNINIHV
ncbi:uncharacterized protein LOC132728749 [Ruditapes philippinarum]|uniref:uncharacterized protein LOC132728749 n=1 Tax=Ruditapes philippinarum TaxID=129788 RepID=UPI00295B63FB|nr:uncharacterized protein LOC132728749 [Ruditapes philippinarum]